MRKEQEAADMFSNLEIHILLSTLQQLAKHPGRPLQRHTSFFAWGVTPVLATIWDSWVWCCFVVVDQVLLGREEGIDFWLEWLISPIILLGGPPHPTTTFTVSWILINIFCNFRTYILILKLEKGINSRNFPMFIAKHMIAVNTKMHKKSIVRADYQAVLIFSIHHFVNSH